MSPKSRRTGLALPLMFVAAVALGACGSVPKPTAEMASARTTMDSARQAGAGEVAPLALDRARLQLEQAEQASADGDNEKARRLAELAAVNAELARVEAEQARTESAAAELQAGIATLKKEINRRAQ